MAMANKTEPSAGANVGLEVGEIVECTVEQIMPYGAFVRIAKTGRKGMIHISEISYSFVKDINEVLKISDKINAKVIRLDERGRIDLSLKQTTEPPAPRPQQKFARQQPSNNRENFRNNNRSGVDRKPREFRERTPREAAIENKEKQQETNERDFQPRQQFRDFHAMREAYREANPEEADTFEKKMASFLKTSEAKITDLNTRNSARSGRNVKRRSSSRDY